MGVAIGCVTSVVVCVCLSVSYARNDFDRNATMPKSNKGIVPGFLHDATVKTIKQETYPSSFFFINLPLTRDFGDIKRI